MHFALKINRLIPIEDEGRRPWLASRQVTFEGIIVAWAELTIALNSINRWTL
jgi:hypothetical protein